MNGITAALKGSKYASATFWVDAADRGFASFFQALVTTNLLDSSGVVGLDWPAILSLSGGYALASVATSIAFRGGANKTINPDTGITASTV